MAKERTTISVDGALLEKAHRQGVNISGYVEGKLRQMLHPVKQDLPSDLLNLKCTQCLKDIEYGFLCEERNLFLCQECQDKFNMKLCPHDARGEHFHLRIPGFEGQHTDKLK